MVSNLKQSTKKMLSDSNWLDEISRKQLVDKIDRLKVHVFAPESYFNRTFLDQIATSVKDFSIFLNFIHISRKLLDSFVNFRWK